MTDRDWKQADEDMPLEKYGDVRAMTERYRVRHLPSTKQPETTPEILAQRQAKDSFTVKRTK